MVDIYVCNSCKDNVTTDIFDELLHVPLTGTYTVIRKGVFGVDYATLGWSTVEDYT